MINDNGWETKTDQELVKLALLNQEHFSYIIKRYQDKLLRYIIRISGVSYKEAEDILQDALVKVYLNLNDFDSNLKFSSWLYRIVRNQAISNHRKKKARPQCVVLDKESNLLENLTADLHLAGQIDKHYLKANINNVLRQLPDKYQEVLILRFFENKDYQEISDILKKPMGSVASLISRAKQKFKQQYLKKYEQ